jgi:peptidoglycan biosynthesis protein MviN/MurJ (putative lipid II flippase)
MTPVIINSVSLLFYMPIIYLLCLYFKMGYFGIAISASVVHVINCWWYLVVLRKKLGRVNLSDYYKYAGKILGFSALVAILCMFAHWGITLVVSDTIADLLSLFAGFLVWLALMIYLLVRQDVYLLKVYYALKLRLAVLP